MNVIIDGVEYKPVETLPEIPEGFIRHDGGGCPVDGETIVDICWPDGAISYGKQAGAFGWTRCRKDNAVSGEILAYKVHKPTVMIGDVECPVADVEGLYFIRSTAIDACWKSSEDRDKVEQAIIKLLTPKA